MKKKKIFRMRKKTRRRNGMKKRRMGMRKKTKWNQKIRIYNKANLEDVKKKRRGN